tara:strand:+ start:346 stop:549 length:204 start_codon:yes stop_codon:yes gene_type:complete
MRLFDMLTSADIKRIKEDQGKLGLAKRIEELEKEVEELKADLARAKEDHQYDNLVHQNELEKLLKKF